MGAALGEALAGTNPARLFEGRGAVSNGDEADRRAQIEAREKRLATGGNNTGVLAVVSGPGLRMLYRGLGADVVDGGPTMNPSTDELLAGIHSVGAEGVLVLPNSANVVLAAEHAAELSDRKARVLDRTSQQAGLVAMIELDPSSTLRENAIRLHGAFAHASTMTCPECRQTGSIMMQGGCPTCACGWSRC